MTGTSARWLAFAAIGLVVAVAIAALATRLVSEKIGISAEPLSAASSLVPEHVSHPRQPHRHHGAVPTNTSGVGVISTTTTSAPVPAPSAPASSGEHGDHRGGDD